MTTSGEILKKVRRNIHTYPFKYTKQTEEEFFAKEKAAIYIHIPFCSTKCHFCEYTVYVKKDDNVIQSYVDDVCREIRAFPKIPVFPQYSIDAIYFGGGTPGLLTGNQIEQLIKACAETFELVPDCEICVEFDPKAVTKEKLEQIKAAGVSRVSVGVQVFNEELLQKVNRPHNMEDIFRAFSHVNEVGFPNVNVDLIYPLPGLTIDIWKDSVDKALEFNTACVTIYGLEVWPNTAYHNWYSKGKLSLPDAGEEVEMYEYAVGELSKRGYIARSNSGFYNPSMTKEYCRFLDYYWRTWPMIGFGVSSKSVVGSHLWTNVKPLDKYSEMVNENKVPMDFGTKITKPQEMRRVMIRGLKMTEVDKGYFYSRFGVEMEDVFKDEIESLVEDGLLINDASKVKLTLKGQIYGTNVYERFYTEDDIRPAKPGEIEFGISTMIQK